MKKKRRRRENLKRGTEIFANPQGLKAVFLLVARNAYSL
jgi:hypothetical protein